MRGIASQERGRDWTRRKTKGFPHSRAAKAARSEVCHDYHKSLARKYSWMSGLPYDIKKIGFAGTMAPILRHNAQTPDGILWETDEEITDEERGCIKKFDRCISARRIF